MVEWSLPKPQRRVRFPYPAPLKRTSDRMSFFLFSPFLRLPLRAKRLPAPLLPHHQPNDFHDDLCVISAKKIGYRFNVSGTTAMRYFRRVNHNAARRYLPTAIAAGSRKEPVPDKTGTGSLRGRGFPLYRATNDTGFRIMYPPASLNPLIFAVIRKFMPCATESEPDTFIS